MAKRIDLIDEINIVSQHWEDGTDPFITHSRLRDVIQFETIYTEQLEWLAVAQGAVEGLIDGRR